MKYLIMTGQRHPVYNHDCDRCQYLGSIRGSDEIYDCYLCLKGLASYVGRYSSMAGGYVSLPMTMLDSLAAFEPYKTMITLHQTK
jgi:hypothetical protein